MVSYNSYNNRNKQRRKKNTQRIRKNSSREKNKVSTFSIIKTAIAGVVTGISLVYGLNLYLDNLVQKSLNDYYKNRTGVVEETSEQKASELEYIVNFSQGNENERYSPQDGSNYSNESIKNEIFESTSTQSLDENLFNSNERIRSNLISKIQQTEFNDRVSRMYADLITKYPLLYSTAYKVSIEHNFDPALIMGLLTIEGGIQMKYLQGERENGIEVKINNLLNKDIKGVCQIAKSTWQTYGRDYSWEEMNEYEPNITVAVRTLKAYLKMFGYELSDALVAYNLGPGKALNIKKKYAKREEEKIAEILQRWVNQGFREYEQPAYYPRRILESAYHFRKVLEESGVYDQNVHQINLSQDYIQKLPAKSKHDEVVLGNHFRQEL